MQCAFVVLCSVRRSSEEESVTLNCTYRTDGVSDVSPPSGSRAVLHGHVTAQDSSGGAEPGSHTSGEGSHGGRAQPQLRPAAGLRPRSQVTPAKRRGFRCVRLFLTHCRATASIQLVRRKASLMSYKEHIISYLYLCSSAGRNLPRSLLGSAVGGDSEGGVFAVPTTLPPNSSRHNKMFSPNKEAELAFRQQLDSISVRHKDCAWCAVHSNMHICGINVYTYVVADAVRSFPFQAEKTTKQTTSETPCGSGERRPDCFLLFIARCGLTCCWWVVIRF